MKTEMNKISLLIYFAIILTVACAKNNSIQKPIVSTDTELIVEVETTTKSSLANTLLNIGKFILNPFGINKEKENFNNETNERTINIQEEVTSIEKKNSGVDDLICPNDKQARYQLFPTLCKINLECKNLGDDYRCCKLFGDHRCVQGIPKPLEDLKHEPILGIPVKCPTEPLTETFWGVQSCNHDKDCDFPRICCPSGQSRYCLNSYIEPDNFPGGRQIAYPVETLTKYFQCTTPPPRIFEPFPKACNTTLDCLPFLCCLENGQKNCRPPKKSLFALLTDFSSRLNVGFIKDFTSNLSIKK